MTLGYFRTLIISLCLALPIGTLAQSKSLGAGRIGFTTPGAPWTFVLSAKNFTIADQKMKPDGKSGYFLMNNEVEHFTVSL